MRFAAFMSYAHADDKHTRGRIGKGVILLFRSVRRVRLDYPRPELFEDEAGKVTPLKPAIEIFRKIVYMAARNPRIHWINPQGPVMARKKPKGKGALFTAFNVNYEDGRVTSNRRVANAELDQSYGESIQELARAAIERQDLEIAQRSGQSRAKIKSIARA